MYPKGCRLQDLHAAPAAPRQLSSRWKRGDGHANGEREMSGNETLGAEVENYEAAPDSERAVR